MPKLLAMAVAVAFLAAACSGDDDAGQELTDSPAATRASEPDITRTPRDFASPMATDTPLATESTQPLRIGLVVHLEGWPLGDEAAFLRYVSAMRDYAALFEQYGAKITWEAGNAVVIGSTQYGDNVLLEMQERGHAVGVHADLGGSQDDTQLELDSGLAEKKAAVQALGVNVRHVSGICSHLDWVGAAIQNQFSFVSSSVSYCWTGVPVESRPLEYRDCASPTDCHDTEPADLPARITPWRPASSVDWTTHDPAGGLVLLPGSGGLNCRDDERASLAGPGGCPFEQTDIDWHTADIEVSLAARQPGVVHAHYIVTSMGSILDIESLESWLQAIQPYVDSGVVRWATLGEMYDAYVASE